MIHHYLQNIVDGDISIRFLGDNPPLVVEYGVGADAGPAPDGDVIGPDERLHVVPLLQPGQNPVVQRPVVDRAVTGSHPEASLKQQGKNNLTRIKDNKYLQNFQLFTKLDDTMKAKTLILYSNRHIF